MGVGQHSQTIDSNVVIAGGNELKVIGVTGGIGTGKSSVTSYIASLGYSVIDADVIAHDVARQKEVLEEIRSVFGDSVIAEDGELDRKAMAEIVFNNTEKKNRLESIITRRVIERVADFIELYRAGTIYAMDDVVFLDAPTLFETGADRLTDEVWVVTSDLKTRLDRASRRDGTDISEIEARIAAQMPEADEIDRADAVISNDGTLEDLHSEVDRLLAAIAF